jgi:hypothetical protein
MLTNQGASRTERTLLPHQNADHLSVLERRPYKTTVLTYPNQADRHAPLTATATEFSVIHVTFGVPIFVFHCALDINMQQFLDKVVPISWHSFFDENEALAYSDKIHDEWMRKFKLGQHLTVYAPDELLTPDDLMMQIPADTLRKTITPHIFNSELLQEILQRHSTKIPR